MHGSMQRSRLSIETLLFAVILVLAFALRFVNLGGSPLTDYEAVSALQAHSLAAGQPTELGMQPAYVLFTSLLFRLFSASEFLARLLPALCGMALVFLPFLWSGLFGKRIALALSFFLAVDPGLVALSRLASGTILAVTAVALLLTAWRAKRPVLLGISAALALLAAPSVLYAVGAALLVIVVLGLQLRFERDFLRVAGFAFLAAMVLGGTFFLTVPSGLTVLPSMVSGLFLGQPVLTPATLELILVALIGYTLPALILGGMGAFRAWLNSSALGKGLSLFAAFSLVLILINPNRQVADLIWVVVPLCVLGAVEVVRHLRLPEEGLGVAISELVLMLVMAVYLGLVLFRAVRSGAQLFDPSNAWLPYLLILGVVAFAGLATLLIGLGWSMPAANRGLSWAMISIFVLLLISTSTRFARLDANAANELWSPGPAAGQAGIMRAALADLEFWRLDGNPTSVALQSESAAARWELRAFSQPGEGSTPSIALAPWAGEVPAEFDGYRGLSFAGSVVRGWDAFPPDILGWFFFRHGPVQPQLMALWVNTALVPGGNASIESSP